MFIVEAKEHLENANNIMLDLEQNPDDKDKLNELFRAMHTIKGAAGFLGLVEIQELSHKMETVLDKCRGGELKFEGDIPDLMFKGIDMLVEMVDKLEAGEENWQVDVSEVVEALIKIAESGSSSTEEKKEKKEKKSTKKKATKKKSKKKEEKEESKEEDESGSEESSTQVETTVQIDEELLKQIAEEYDKQVQALQDEIKKKKEEKKEESKEEEQEEEQVKEDIYLIFEVEGIRYLLPATKVLEVTELLRTTTVPDTPLFVEGVANLRGSIITVFNTDVFFESPDLKKVELVTGVSGNTSQKSIEEAGGEGAKKEEAHSSNNDVMDNVFVDDERKVVVMETEAYGTMGVIVDKVLVVKRISDKEFVQYPGVKGREFFKRIYKDDQGVVIELDFEEMLKIKTEKEWKKGKKERRV